jgi:hypothetical protein
MDSVAGESFQSTQLQEKAAAAISIATAKKLRNTLQ